MYLLRAAVSSDPSNNEGKKQSPCTLPGNVMRSAHCQGSDKKANLLATGNGSAAVKIPMVSVIPLYALLTECLMYVGGRFGRS